MEKIPICCNTRCDMRFTCEKFSNALDVNEGLVRANYEEISICDYEKEKGRL